MDNLSLYNFENAKLTLTLAQVIPPLYNLTVTGKTGSLNPTINLVKTGAIVDGYVEVAVEGKDGMAIGSMDYTRQISLQELEGTKGVLVKGENKTVELNWEVASTKTGAADLADVDGMKELTLQSYVNDMIFGATETTLKLTIDGNYNVTGTAVVVTHGIENPIVCKSHVTGKFFPSSIMINPSTIEVTGYPEIHWPSGGGVGPVIPQNYKASITLYANVEGQPHQQDMISYQYRNGQFNWVKLNQKVKVIS